MRKLVSTPLLFCILFLYLKPTNLTAQTATAKTADNAANWGVTLYGFIRHDMTYDSHQMVSSREGQFDLYAKDKLLDANGVDINAAPTFQMLAISSRVGGSIIGPKAFGAKTSAILEAEFFGNFDGGINELRLRHAWIKLDWAKTQLAFGQYWHPMFVTDCSPGVINFNTGAPFQPFSRSPQVRLTQKLDHGNKLSLVMALIAQRDFASTAPTGYAATDPFRNAAIPNMHVQLQYKDAHVVTGVGIDYKSLRPRLNSGTPNVVSHEMVNSAAFIAYLKVKTTPVVFKAEAVMGSNLTDLVMLGGYLGNVATTGAVETYQPTQVKSYWFDVSGTGKKVVPGLFVGYTSNDGASDNATAAYGRGIGVSGRGIKNIFRASPRVEVISGKFKVGTEIEYTSTQYGTDGPDSKITGSTDKLNNTRVLLTTTLSF